MFKGSVCAGLLVIFFLCQTAQAADTTETFDVGATDFEFYTGFEGVGLDKYERSVYAEVLLGIGFIDRFSGYIAAAGASNEYFEQGEGAVGFGLFGTPVDTDHFDLDLFLDAGVASDAFGLTPGLELNFDLAPDLKLWGVYVRVNEGLTGRDESIEDDPATTAINETSITYAFAPITELTLGTYWTVAENHQLLLEYEMSVANNPAAGEDTVEIGTASIGYNIMLTDSIEMINQLAFDIPQNDEDPAFSIGIGFIFAMPSVYQAAEETTE